MATTGFHPHTVPAPETSLICPRCDFDDVRRVRRQGFWERWLLPRVSAYPFLCGRCGTRFLARRREDQCEIDACDGVSYWAS